jgi:hypothetical protein
MYAGQGAYMEWTAARRGATADVDEMNIIGGCVDGAPEHQHGIRESPPERTPDLITRDENRIRDTAPILLCTRVGDALIEWIWAPRARSKKPIFNFRSEDGHCQRPKAAATHSSDIDPPHATAVA